MSNKPTPISPVKAVPLRHPSWHWMFLATALATQGVCGAQESAAVSEPKPADTRHGLFNWLDSRSAYSQDAFPEPFLVDDSALETNEARFDWLRTNGQGQKNDSGKIEFEKGFGLLTTELEFNFERNLVSGQGTDTVEQGVGSINLGARYPVYQFVSGSEFIDLTIGVAGEIGIPTNSQVSKTTEVVPKAFADMKIGNHFTIQSIFGYSVIYGGGGDGGLHTFEYGLVFGYSISHRDLALPNVLQFIPVFEIKGESQLNKTDSDNLIGDFGFRVNLKSIGMVQPRIGLGYVFPLDQGGRDELHRGLITSLVFEY